MDSTPLPAGSYVMSVTPFDEDGRIDEDALREHVQWQCAEGISVVPAALATGEGSLLTDAEVFRLTEIVVAEAAGRFPVVIANREFANAAENIRFADEIAARGADALLVYPAVLGHGITPTAAMLEAYYDEILPKITLPVLVSNNQVSGFEVPLAVHERLIGKYDNVAAFYKNHADFINCASFFASIGPRATVLTGLLRLPIAFLLGASGVLDNLQNIAPRTCRALHDALHGGDLTAAGAAFTRIISIQTRTAQFGQEERVSSVPVTKGILRALGRPGSFYPRPPYLPLSREQESRLAKLVDELQLRELEGVV